MPSIAEQFEIPEAYTADFSVVRALLQKRRTYEQAVSMLKPYRETREPDNSTRDALRKIAERAIQKRNRAIQRCLRLSASIIKPGINLRRGLASETRRCFGPEQFEISTVSRQSRQRPGQTSS
jgi:hypothetical protein